MNAYSFSHLFISAGLSPSMRLAWCLTAKRTAVDPHDGALEPLAPLLAQGPVEADGDGVVGLARGHLQVLRPLDRGGCVLLFVVSSFFKKRGALLLPLHCHTPPMHHRLDVPMLSMLEASRRRRTVWRVSRSMRCSAS